VFENVLFIVQDILRDLHLPKENTLFLLTPALALNHSATTDGWVIGILRWKRTFSFGVYCRSLGLFSKKHCTVEWLHERTEHLDFFHPSLNGVLFPMFSLLVEGECQILVF